MLKRLVPGVALLAAALMPVGCSQNDPDAPLPGGPSTGLVITKVTAIPDLVQTGSGDQVTIRLEARLRTGDPLPGRSVAFYVVGASAAGDFATLCSGAAGSMIVNTCVTDANGVCTGVFEAGTPLVFAKSVEDCIDPLADKLGLDHYSTFVRGKLTDPRETEGEYEIQDDVAIEHYP